MKFNRKCLSIQEIYYAIESLEQIDFNKDWWQLANF